MKKLVYTAIMFACFGWSGQAQKASSTGNGLPRSVDQSVWEAGAWKPNWHADKTYDNQGRIVSEQFNHSTGEIERHIYTYTDNSETELIEKKENGEWVPQQRYSYQYDSYGNVLNYKTEVYENGNWRRDDEWDYMFEYLNNLLMSKTISRFDKTSGQVAPDMRYLYTYNPTGQVTTETMQDFWNNAFVNQQKREYNYENSVLAFEDMYTWVQNNWRLAYRSNHAWQENNGRVTTRENWSEADKKFTPVTRYTLSIDSRGNMVLYQIENWLNNAWFMFYGYKYLLAYDYFNLIERLMMSWIISGPDVKTTGGQWVNQTKEVFSDFLNLGISDLPNRSGDLLIYPNPSIEHLVRVAGIEGDGEMAVELFTLNGQRLSRILVTVRDNELEIPTDKLSSGTYIIRILDYSGSFKKGVLIKAHN
jgi:hypothetical protein